MKLVFHIGYPKTGTTFLQKEVFPKIENINYHDFFNTPDRDFKRLLTEISDPKDDFQSDDFKKSFSKFLSENRFNFISNEILCGDAHHKDKRLPLRIADRLFSIYPDARIIVGIRKPAGAIVSHYKQHIHQGGVLCFEDYVKEKIDVAWFNYEDHLNHLKKLFGENRVYVYDFQNLKKDPKAFINGITDFLGVDAPEFNRTKRNVGYGRKQIEAARIMNRFFKTPANPKGLIPWSGNWWFFPFPPRFFLQNKFSFWLDHDMKIISDESKRKLTMMIENNSQ